MVFVCGDEVEAKSFSSCMALLNIGWPVIYTEQSHCAAWNPNFSISSFNAIEHKQGCSWLFLLFLYL